MHPLEEEGEKSPENELARTCIDKLINAVSELNKTFIKYLIKN